MDNIPDLLKVVRHQASSIAATSHFGADMFFEAADTIESLSARVAELEHKEIHYMQMLEDDGIDSSAAKQSECIYQARVKELEEGIKNALAYSDALYQQDCSGILRNLLPEPPK